jgi:hypothetical protein
VHEIPPVSAAWWFSFSPRAVPYTSPAAWCFNFNLPPLGVFLLKGYGVQPWVETETPRG